jgi:hypothetical protein
MKESIGQKIEDEIVTQTTVRYDLEQTDKGTRVRLTHKGFAGNREAFESYRGGWPAVIDLLRVYLETPKM